MRIEEAKQQAMAAALDKERAELEARKAEEARMMMDAEAKRIELETQKLLELHLADQARAEADRALAEQAQAQLEAALAREAQMQAQKEAELLRIAKEKAEDEAQAQALARLEESQRRRAEAEQARSEAEEKARIAEELSRKLMEAQQESLKAKELAARLEEMHRAEQARLAAERAALEASRKASDYNSVDFTLPGWLQRSLEGAMVSSPEVSIDARTMRGMVAKTGAINKAFKNRLFVLSVDDKTLRYYESEKSKKENGMLRGEEILRVYVSPAAALKTKHSFVIETVDRLYVCKTNSDEATRLWVAALSVFPARNAAVGAGYLS